MAKKTKTTKFLDRIIPTKPPPPRQSAKKRPLEGVVYFLNEAPVFKLALLGFGVWGVSKIVRGIGDAFDDSEGKDNPLPTVVPGFTPVFIGLWYNPKLGYWYDEWNVPPTDDLVWKWNISNITTTVRWDIIPSQNKRLPMTINKIAEYYTTIYDYDPDDMTNEQICNYMNISLTFINVMNTAQVRKVLNVFLKLTNESLYDYIRDQTGWFNDWDVSPFKEIRLKLLQKITAAGGRK